MKSMSDNHVISIGFFTVKIRLFFENTFRFYNSCQKVFEIEESESPMSFGAFVKNHGGTSVSRDKQKSAAIFYVQPVSVHFPSPHYAISSNMSSFSVIEWDRKESRIWRALESIQCR